ncbi:squalene synthase-like isoform X1 [Ascaphus truei]|uniref:squalene synthase-like isoform X1 n=1 Tax=Ascaphus truei TaxID=8439 RepID=UPI003F5AA650
MEILNSLGHPKEIWNLLKFRMRGFWERIHKLDNDADSESLKTCYKHLNETSRSFAAFVQFLDSDLRHSVCIYYLVFRALDTIEDDMTISLEAKIPMLHKFHTFLYDAEWKYTESKDKYRQVLEDFPTISLEFRKLPKDHRDIIVDVCRQAGVGMSEFLHRKIESLLDWDMYCHHAAGIVVIGIYRLFCATELDISIDDRDIELCNSMGLFLEKVNIIRDFLEDQVKGLELWPKEVWSKYAKKLSDLAEPENTGPALQCLNELIMNALHHIPDVLNFLSRVKNQNIFRAFAISQVMAIATLSACCSNQQVFKGVVKIRKGQTITFMMDVSNLQAVKAIMYQYVEEINQKMSPSDLLLTKTDEIITVIKTLCLPNGSLVYHNKFFPVYVPCVVAIAALIFLYFCTMSQVSGG